jgi:uncharacterized protein YbjT (DUF2867 family)
MTTQSSHANPILVTGAAGAVGSIGRNVTEMLLAKGYKVRALVRREDERASMIRPPWITRRARTSFLSVAV